MFSEFAAEISSHDGIFIDDGVDVDELGRCRPGFRSLIRDIT